MLSVTLWTRLSLSPGSKIPHSPPLTISSNIPPWQSILPFLAINFLPPLHEFSPFRLPLIVVPNALRAVGETHFNSSGKNSFPRSGGGPDREVILNPIALPPLYDWLPYFFFFFFFSPPPDKSHASRYPNKALALPVVPLLTTNLNFSPTKRDKITAATPHSSWGFRSIITYTYICIE